MLKHTSAEEIFLSFNITGEESLAWRRCNALIWMRQRSTFSRGTEYIVYNCTFPIVDCSLWFFIPLTRLKRNLYVRPRYNLLIALSLNRVKGSSRSMCRVSMHVYTVFANDRETLWDKKLRIARSLEINTRWIKLKIFTPSTLCIRFANDNVVQTNFTAID